MNNCMPPVCPANLPMNFWDWDLSVLLEMGRNLECSPSNFGGSARALMVRRLLRIRDKQGQLAPLVPNRAQRQFATRASGRDIVLKARQLGITTWVAARFFVSTITRPGTLTVQVAHDQSSAEGIFRIVHRFLENLPGKTGNDKKEAALSFVTAALSLTEAVTQKEIVDEDKFRDGLGKIIDGTVECLNASAWAKAK